VPIAQGIWSRPLMLDTVHGAWVNVMRSRASGVVNRHRHPGPVHGYVIQGRWRYLEHDWTAEPGAYVFEPPGETHTLVVEPETDEMLTLFWVSSCMIYLDEDGRQIGYDDVFTKIDQFREHLESVGLGADYVERFIR